MDIETALQIAIDAHRGQKDRAGRPLILHPLRVALAAETPDQQVVAILHDVIEKTDHTLDVLVAAGLSASQVAALDAVTRREGEAYPAFIARARQNPLGRAVKILDLQDNAHQARTADPGHPDDARLETYTQALRQIES